MTGADLVKAGGGALVGVLLGWTGHALTLQGRVAALEQGQTAIVVRLDALLAAKGVQAPESPRP